MNKKLTVLAVAAVMATPMIAQAGDSKLYGRIHVAVEQIDNGKTDEMNLSGSSRKGSRIGLKGSTDTNFMDAKAVYQFELGLKQEDGEGAYYERDTWVGLSSKSMGTVRAGTMATSYKQSGAAVDPLFTTTLEGRGGIGIMSSTMHAGNGYGRGRATQTIRYDSPSFAGAKFIANYQLANGASNNMGVGVHYKNGPAFAFLDYQSIESEGKDTITATKIGGKYVMGDFTLGGQYEIDGGAIGGFPDSKKGKALDKDTEANILFLNGKYKMGATAFILSFGMQDESKSKADNDHTGFGLAVTHTIAKKSMLYAGYGSATGGDKYNGGEDLTALAVGFTHSF